MSKNIQIQQENVLNAYKNASDEQINEMKEALDLQEFYEGKKDPEHIRYMDSRFHDMLYAAADSIVLYDTLMPLHRKTQKFRHNGTG